MTRLGVPTLGWLTAILLSLITLWVFWTLRYYGPESTLHQYHQAAAQLNRGFGESLSYPGFSAGRSWDLWRITVGIMDQGRTRYSIVDSKRGANEATMIVEYDSASEFDTVLVWRLSRKQGVWLVNANETTLTMQSPLFR